MSEILPKVQQLRDELAYQEHRIFVLESPTVSPRDYWDMRERLQNLEREHKLAASSDSASLRFPSPTREKFEEFPHSQLNPNIPQLHFLSDLDEYYAGLEAQEGLRPICVGTGITAGPELELFYADGVLEKAILLRDSAAAIDITDNARMIGSIPLTLKPAGSVTDTRVSKVVRQAMGPSTMSPVPPYSNDLVIRGSLSMRITDILSLDRNRINAGHPPYVDVKAAIIASVCAFDPRLTASRRLQFFAQTVRNHIEGIETYWQLLSALKSWGFCVTPLMWRCEGQPEILDFVSALQQEKHQFEYPLEGGGLHVDRLFGLQEDPEVPRSARLVFQETGPDVKVKSTYFAIGRTGAVVPVALLESQPADSDVPDGAPIPAVTGTSLLNVTAGQTVTLVLEEGAPPLIRPVANADSSVLVLTKCPSCDSELESDDDQPFHYCPNRACPGRIRSRIIHLLGPNGLGLSKISVRTAETIFAGRSVSTAALLAFTAEEIDAVAPGTGQLFRTEVEGIKQIPLWRALYLSDIDHLSERDARCLAAFVGSLDGLEKLLSYQRPLEHLCGIAPESYDGVSRWLEKDGLSELTALSEAGVELLDDDAVHSSILRGRIVVVTGQFTHLTRAQVVHEVEKFGGRIDHKVGRMTDILIAGATAEESIESARYYGTAILNEALFLSVLRKIE